MPIAKAISAACGQPGCRAAQRCPVFQVPKDDCELATRARRHEAVDMRLYGASELFTAADHVTMQNEEIGS